MGRLRESIPEQQFNTWIKPLQAAVHGETLELRAPNRFICDFVTDKYAPLIQRVLDDIGAGVGANSANAPRGPVTASFSLAIGTSAAHAPRWEPRQPAGTSDSLRAQGARPREPSGMTTSHRRTACRYSVARR